MSRHPKPGLHAMVAGWIEYDLRLADNAIKRAAQYIADCEDSVTFENRKVNLRRLNAARVYVDRARTWAGGGKGE